MPEAPPCATLSRALGEPMFGTASRVRGWVLLEQAGPWGREAVLESRLDRDLAAALDRHADAAGARLLLIRRPGRGDGGKGRCFIAHSGRRDPWAEGRVLDDPAELLALALAATVGERTWECSHVGGDRFAANLVCLPHGHYFGRVGPQDAPRVVGRYEREVIDLDHYRGRCSDPPVVQAAEWYARRRTGLTGRDELAVVGGRRLDEQVWATSFTAPEGGRLRVVVRAARTAAPRPLTCSSTRPEPPLHTYTLLELRTDREAP